MVAASKGSVAPQKILWQCSRDLLHPSNQILLTVLVKCPGTGM